MRHAHRPLKPPGFHFQDHSVNECRENLAFAALALSPAVYGWGEMEPSFSMLFGREPVSAAHANGRVNLIGEHTDYNGGVLPSPPLPPPTVGHGAPPRAHATA